MRISIVFLYLIVFHDYILYIKKKTSAEWHFCTRMVFFCVFLLLFSCVLFYIAVTYSFHVRIVFLCPSPCVMAAPRSVALAVNPSGLVGVPWRTPASNTPGSRRASMFSDPRPLPLRPSDGALFVQHSSACNVFCWEFVWQRRTRLTNIVLSFTNKPPPAQPHTPWPPPPPPPCCLVGL